MKRYKILFFLLLLCSIQPSWACINDPEDWDDYEYYNDDDYDDCIDGDKLDEVVCTPNHDDDDDNDEWWKRNDDDDNDFNDDNFDWNPDDEDDDTPSNDDTSSSDENQNKKDVESIKIAVKDTVKEIISRFGTQKAYCNIGVKSVFEKLFNNKELNGMVANQMVRYWQNSSHWTSISMSQAQELANQGYFVVAGWINPSGESGHVVVIVPGEETYSNSWGGYVPNSMDTGSNKRRETGPISASFGSNKKDNVKFFIYK